MSGSERGPGGAWLRRRLGDSYLGAWLLDVFQGPMASAAGPAPSGGPLSFMGCMREASPPPYEDQHRRLPTRLPSGEVAHPGGPHPFDSVPKGEFMTAPRASCHSSFFPFFFSHSSTPPLHCQTFLLPPPPFFSVDAHIFTNEPRPPRSQDLARKNTIQRYKNKSSSFRHEHLFLAIVHNAKLLQQPLVGRFFTRSSSQSTSNSIITVTFESGVYVFFFSSIASTMYK
jgi:hypothetical protein